MRRRIGEKQWLSERAKAEFELPALLRRRTYTDRFPHTSFGKKKSIGSPAKTNNLAKTRGGREKPTSISQTARGRQERIGDSRSRENAEQEKVDKQEHQTFLANVLGWRGAR